LDLNAEREVADDEYIRGIVVMHDVVNTSAL
jgi:hypothetical protein